jgi:hypothetical protein
MWRNFLSERNRLGAMCVSLLAAVIALALSPQAGATTWKVANNGVDSASCGASANPCRSITQVIANASDGDKIVVGPGTYGDLNNDGILGDSPGEENPGVVGCMICVNKSLTLVSSDGAAETLIDAGLVPNLSETVAIAADNVKFGAAGQGFTVTNVLTAPDQENPTNGITTGADQVIIRGNRVIVERSEIASPTFSGIFAGNFPDNGNTVLIEGNQVIGWEQGIAASGVNITVTQNAVQFNYRGIAIGPGTAKGNVVTDNANGIVTYQNGQNVKGNAVLGNGIGIDASAGGTIQNNNIFGNGCGVNIQGFPAPTSVIATSNYWGAATGPGPAPANGVCGSQANVAIVTPFARQPFTVTMNVTP